MKKEYFFILILGLIAVAQWQMRLKVQKENDGLYKQINNSS